MGDFFCSAVFIIKKEIKMLPGQRERPCGSAAYYRREGGASEHLFRVVFLLGAQ